MRVTKKRDRELHLALSLDDYLYEKFKRQQAELHRLHDQYIRRPRRLWAVIERQADGTFLKRQVVDVQVSSEGTQVVIA